MQPRKGEASFRVTKASTAVPAARPKLAATDPPPQEDGASSTWIDFNALASGQSRKDVRSQAARASAAARRATLAKKQARKGTQPGSLVFALPTTPATRRTAAAAVDVVRKLSDKDTLARIKADQSYFHKLVGIVTHLLESRPLSMEQPGEVSLAHSSIRTMLWDGMTSSVTLFQVALFMAGTHANTCGLPRSAFAHMGPGLVALRGASIDAIQQKITGADAESIAPIAIALLAGWERRYGDPTSYEVHMKAWKSLAFSGKSLEEQNVATLTDLTLDMYRLGLDDRAGTTPGGDKPRPIEMLSSLPEGLRVFDMRRTETKSLLDVTVQLARYSPHLKSEIPRLRKLGLENMAWSPTHTRGYEPNPDYEDTYDTAELNALYHLRAVNISICGIMLGHSMQVHQIEWDFDLKGGLHIHTISCTHLRTEALLGTKYQDIALWARFALCSFSRDSTQDAYLSSLLHRMDLKTWSHAQALFERLIYHEALFKESFQSLFRTLTAPHGWESYSDLLQSDDALVREHT